jgi:hypothetical protein
MSSENSSENFRPNWEETSYNENFWSDGFRVQLICLLENLWRQISSEKKLSVRVFYFSKYFLKTRRAKNICLIYFSYSDKTKFSCQQLWDGLVECIKVGWVSFEMRTGREEKSEATISEVEGESCRAQINENNFVLILLWNSLPEKTSLIQKILRNMNCHGENHPHKEDSFV